MSFEEFFKKKRIDLVALEKGEPALFSEFKTHYDQMGEKSFDHTKKYWFNKLRRQFPLAIEVKTEKVHIENRLAEQTVADTLTAPAATIPKVGFTSKFRAANIAKPAAEVMDDKKEASAETNTDPIALTPENTGAKPAFVPRFKMKPKAEEPEKPAGVEQQPEVTEVKPVYVPKFKMKPKVEAEETKAAAEVEPQPEVTEARPAYVPKFKMKPKSEEEEPAPPGIEEEKPTQENTEAKPAYKPRFNMKNIPPKE